MNRVGLVLFLPIVLAGVVLGQGSSSGSSQLKNPLNARSAALGNATVSDGGQLSSWLINPANLFARGPSAVSLTHSQWTQDIRSEFIGVQLPLKAGTLGLSVSTTTVPGIEIREKPGPAIGAFSARFVSLQAGFATTILQDFVAGVSAKYLYEKLYVDQTTGIGVDFGILYHPPVEGLQVGASVTNAGSVQQFRHQRSDLPTIGRLGGTYKFDLTDFTVGVSTAYEAGLQDSEHHVLAGIEVAYARFLTARLGYVTDYEVRGLTAGIGLRYEFLQVEYAYIPFTAGLGDGHIISLGVEF